MTKLRVTQQSLFGAEEPVTSPTPPAPARYKPATLYKIPLDNLQPDPAQPRIHFAEEALELLAASLKSQGVIQPVLFRLDEQGEAILVAGERRWRAARQAGLKTIPALCVVGDPLEISMVENTLREDLTAVELAEALGRLKELRGYTLEQLSVLIGKAVSTVSEILSLNHLPPEVRDVCRKNQSIPRDILVRIARAETQEEMVRLFERYVQGTLSRNKLKEQGSQLRPLKFSVLAKQLTSYNSRITTIEVATLKPAQRKKLKPLLQQAARDISTLLGSLADD